jgi:outer membrane receptor protein involved in Fe transport
MHAKRNVLFCTTILAGLVAVSGPAFAQSAPASSQDATEVDEIVITGSLIRRSPENSPTPLIQVQREDLLTTGQATVIDYLATIPALSNSLVPSDTTGSNLNDGGVSLANLRSLGSGRTLTLVDGRRHVGAFQGNLAVDVDTIPRLLIENIEIVTGGASSIYGADAVSGVLNFILRDDFEGVEIDANYGMINQDGQANRRVSALIGRNWFDDRLNTYLHAEYDANDEIQTTDIDWLANNPFLLGVDADPAASPSDGIVDQQLFTGDLRRLDRPRWGQTTLANAQQPSMLNDPDVAFASCTSLTSGNCYAVDPAKTWWFDGTTARLANFGQRVGATGANRPYNYGGDGDIPANFGQFSRSPESESQRFQAGMTFNITDEVRLTAEAKYITEDTFDIGQPTFFDIFLNDGYAANVTNTIRSTSQFDLRLDNAFLPANLRSAILANTVTNYSAPTATADGTPLAPVSRAWARHSMFGPDRFQENNREVERYVVALEGERDNLLFARDVAWSLSYVYGEARNENFENGVDVLRFNLAADAVVDSAGVVNGRPGEVVCRAQLIAAQGGVAADRFRGGDLRDSAQGQADLAQCTPLNVFGNGNQSQAALDYIAANISVSHVNQQEQALGIISGNLWDLWGAGPIGLAVGAEYRREYAEGLGRSRSTGDRFLFLNTGADFPGSEYETEEAFTELSIPLFRDSFLGEYADLTGSYRYADYTTVGEQEVWGVNFTYRPIQDIAFKTSFNTSIRVPNLAENFSPYSQTFANGFVDPCATAQITAQQNTEIRNNRIANCTALAQQKGLSYDFAGATATNTDDYVPVYTSGIAGVNGGNPFLQPEESESFTFSTVIQPRFIPNFSLVLDYYEIEITNVIASVTAQTAANNCVNGTGLNPAACSTIFRNVAGIANPQTPQDASEAFKVGAPQGDPIGGFIQGSINYAALTTRGLDFTARYRWDFEEMMGRNWGVLNYSIGGLWLIEQENFLNAADPNDGNELSSDLFYPRVRFTSSLTWTPNETWSVNWTMDWQTAQDIISPRDFINNADSRPVEYLNTGNFARHDFTFRWNVRDDLSLRTGVVNAFDNEQAEWLGTTLYSNFDPYGRRFFIGLNYRPF